MIKIWGSSRNEGWGGVSIFLNPGSIYIYTSFVEGEGTREVEDSEVGEAEVFYIMQS